MQKQAWQWATVLIGGLLLGYGHLSVIVQPRNDIKQSAGQAIPPSSQTAQLSSQSAPLLTEIAKPPAATILLLGLDSRSGEPARADTIMLTVVDPKQQTVHVIPIPRDTYVEIPGYGRSKINHAMTYGGSRLMRQTVANWLGISIDDTVILDFQGFRKLVDLLGGIILTIEKKMDYDDPTDGTNIHLQAGTQLLDGKKALDYARFRHDSEADTGRMRRQRQVLNAMMDKGMSLTTLPKLFQIRHLLGEHLHVSMSSGEILRYILTFRELKPDEVHVETIQGVNRVAPDDGIWYFFVENGERERIKQMLSDWLRRNQ